MGIYLNPEANFMAYKMLELLTVQHSLRDQLKPKSSSKTHVTVVLYSIVN